MEQTITTLYNESPDLIPKSEISKLIESVNEIRGNERSGLIEWWRVFWDILKESKRTKKALGCEAQNVKTITFDPACDSGQKRIRKQQSSLPTSPILDTLDMTSLTGIEKSLTSSGLMNKDLNKLTPLEAKRIEIALRSNKVSKEAWEIYLKLCKEYQKIPQNIQVYNYKTLFNGVSNVKNGSTVAAVSAVNTVNTINAVKTASSINTHNNISSSTNTSTNSSTIPISSSGSGSWVIDQASQPVDSKQLLLFRQSLYQEYLKKQQASISDSLNTSQSTLPPINLYSYSHNSSTTFDSPIVISPPEGLLANNNFNNDGGSEKEEFFYEFINEYLI